MSSQKKQGAKKRQNITKHKQDHNPSTKAVSLQTKISRLVATGDAIEIEISKLRRDPKFENLLPRSPAERKAISASMKACGFDKATPLIVRKKDLVVIDGYTRLDGAIDAELEKVWVIFVDSDDEDQLRDYALHCQLARRNMTPEAKLAAVVRLYKPQKPGKKKAGETAQGKTSAKIAGLLGVSESAVEGFVRLNKEHPKHVEKIMRGELTVRDAKKAIRKEDVVKSAKKAKAKPANLEAGPDYFGIITALENALHLAAKRTELIGILKRALTEIETIKSTAEQVKS